MEAFANHDPLRLDIIHFPHVDTYMNSMFLSGPEFRVGMVQFSLSVDIGIRFPMPRYLIRYILR